MVAPKKSLRPKSREQVGVENQMRQFGNLEFRADMDEQLKWNPLARLGFEPDQSVVGRPRYNSPDIHEGIRYPYYAEQEYIDETLPGAASGVEYRDVAGRVKPGSVVVNSNTAKNPVWSHEYTHGGIEKVIEYLNEDREFFTEKYGKDTVKLLDEIQTDTNRTKGPNEKLTEMLDDVSKDAEVDIHGHLIPAAGTGLGGMDNTRTAVEDVSSRASLQEYLKKGRVGDNLSGKASFEASFPGYSGIFKAAEDMLEKQGEPLPSEKRGWWERKTRQWLSGNGLFNEGGDVALQTEEALGWTAEGKKFADENPVEVAEEEPTALSIADVPVFDRPMDASENDRWTGVQDELGNREYITAFGRKYFVRLADDQRTNYEKIQQDIIPAVKNYLDNPTAPSKEQTINFLKESLGAAWETFKIPGDLAAGNKGMGDVTLGNIFELAGGTGALSTVSKVPGDSSNTTRTFGGPGAASYRNRALEKAIELKNAGYSPAEIEAATGRVETGSPASYTTEGPSADNIFKFEIDDSAIEIKNSDGFQLLTEATRQHPIVIKNIIPDHKELFWEYPNLDFVEFHVDPALGAGAHFDPTKGRNGAIVVGSEQPGLKNPNSKLFRNAFFHELQHAAQFLDFKETGLLQLGGSPTAFGKFLVRGGVNKSKVADINKTAEKLKDELLEIYRAGSLNDPKVTKNLARKMRQLNHELFKTYMRTASEIEARLSGRRAEKIVTVGGNSNPEITVDLNQERKIETLKEYWAGKPQLDSIKKLDDSIIKLGPMTEEEISRYSQGAINFARYAEGLDSELKGFGPFGPKQAQLEMDFKKESNQEFAQGGIVDMNNQMSFAFAEGGLRDDGMGEDPVSGNEVPSGSMAKEVRDDIPAQLSEGEYVVPADVVRYYGVKFFEDIRDSAKMGLQDMESRGRIGGEPVPAGGPTNDDELSPEEMSAIQGMMGMAEGGIVNMYKQQQDLYSPPNPAVGNNMMNAGGQVKRYAPGGDVVPMPGAATGQTMEQKILTAGQQAQPFVAQPLGSSLFPSANANMAEVTTPTTFVPVKMLNMQTNHSVMANTQQEFDDYSSKGYVVDDGTLKPQPTGGGGGGSTPTPTGNKEPYKDWLASADFNSAEGISKFVAGIEYDPSKSNLDMQTLGATMIAGPLAGIATGLGGAFRGGGLGAISDLRAASLIAKAQGMDKLAAKIDTQVADIIKDGPKILDFLDDIFASGKQKANAWAKKNGHDNIEVATTAGVAPKPPVVDPPAPNNNDNDDPFKDIEAQVAATKAKGEELKKTNTAVASASKEYETNQAAEAEMAEAAEAGGATQGGPGGTYGMNKGGLMAKGKKKKNKK
jgi:hypothetical protein